MAGRAESEGRGEECQDFRQSVGTLILECGVAAVGQQQEQKDVNTVNTAVLLCLKINREKQQMYVIQSRTDCVCLVTASL